MDRGATVALAVIVIGIVAVTLFLVQSRPSGPSLANKVNCQRDLVAVTVEVADHGGVLSTITGTTTATLTSLQNSTSIAESPGTQVTTSSSFTALTGNVVSEWVGLTCTYGG
jgi:hypothetical protein